MDVGSFGLILRTLDLESNVSAGVVLLEFTHCAT